MDANLLITARNLTEIINTRINLKIPSILQEGETFTARLSVTRADGLPSDSFPYPIDLNDSIGIEGLPRSFQFDPNKAAGKITGLKAHQDIALIRGTVRMPGFGKQPLIVSNPAWIFENPPYRLFWGDNHVHTSFSNCHAWRCLDPEWAYQYAKEISLLDFACPADHLRGIASKKERWTQLQDLAKKYNIPGEFVSFLAFESSHAKGYGGDNNVYFLDDDSSYFWLDRKDMRGTAPKVHLQDLWEQMAENGKAFFTVPHHTGRIGKNRTWDEDYYEPKREPLFEIYSSWGSSEMRNSRYPLSEGNNDDHSYFVDAIKAGARFGLIASSDDHATLPGSVHHHRIEPFAIPLLNGFAHKGLAAIRAPELTREALYNAMIERNTYATTHTRSLLDIKIGDASMGQEIPAEKFLKEKREIRVKFSLENANSAKIILMRNGEKKEEKVFMGNELMDSVNEMVFEDQEDLERICLRDSKFHLEPFAVYYIRLEDSNGATQWTSPIWIDFK